MPYRWILFDADGTLFDYDAAEKQALRRTTVDLGLDPRPSLLEDFRAIQSELWPRYARGEITQDFLRVERFRMLLEVDDADEVSDLYLAHLAEGSQLLEGARELLESLHGEFGMALVTNGIADVQNSRLDRSGLRPLFETVVISAEIGHAKPHAAFFDEVFARIGRPRREEVLMVGDNLAVDIQGGADYGVDTCWVNPDARQRPDEPRIDHEVRGVAELRDVLGL
ncbi:MAG: YjjG family noncanonical pyrimidine nucleotidase [Planctomycetota bacterium]|jgi:2-haloacid dehalogenase